MNSKSHYRFETISDLLDSQAARHAHACALQSSDVQLSYEGLHRRITGLSGQLRTFGLGRGSRVGIVLPNGLDMSVVLLAVTSTAIAAPLNPAYREAEFQAYVNDIGVDCIIVPADAHDTPACAVARRNSIPVIGLASDGSALIAPSEFSVELACSPSSDLPNDSSRARPDDIALILLTSGSTGRSKKVPLTHRNICVSVADICFSLQLDSQDACLSMWEQFHIGGLVDLLLAPLASGERIICTNGFDAEQFFNILDSGSPTWFQGVPMTLHEILTVGRRTERDPAKTSLRFVRSVAAALSPQLMERVEAFFQAPVVQTFGMTEAGPLITTNPLPPGIRKPGSTGPSCGPLISIRDPEGREVPAGETGEILVKGDNVISGYEGNEEAAAHSFRDGWFHTGDTGYLDADGYLFLKGRIKEQINRGGEKITPQEIDDVLAAHPEIEQAASFSVSHATLGEDVGVAVVVRENSSLDAGAIRRHIAGQLSDFKVPKTVLFLPSLPRSTIGKVERDTLAAMAESPPETAVYAPPETKLHEVLRKIWAEELNVERVGIDDNFFTLGGDSLSSIRLALGIETLLGIQLPDSAIQEILTVRQMAALIESLPNYDQVLDRIGRDSEAEAFSESRIRTLLCNIAAGQIGDNSTASDTVEGMKNTLMNCNTPHQFDALAKSYLSEVTGDELMALAKVSLTLADLHQFAASRFQTLQREIKAGIIPRVMRVAPWDSKQTWVRRCLANSVRLYTSLYGEVNDKSLIVGFGDATLTLMMPMWTFLSHLDPTQNDLLFLWDPLRKHYCEGVAGLGSDFKDVVMSLQKIVSRLGYRRIISFGPSAGGLAAIAAGITNRWNSIIAVGNADPESQKHLLTMMTRFDSEQSTFGQQRIRIYYSELNEKDCVNAHAAAKITNAEIRPVIGYRKHPTLYEARQRGHLHLARLFHEFFGEEHAASTAAA